MNHNMVLSSHFDIHYMSNTTTSTEVDNKNGNFEFTLHDVITIIICIWVITIGILLLQCFYVYNRVHGNERINDVIRTRRRREESITEAQRKRDERMNPERRKVMIQNSIVIKDLTCHNQNIALSSLCSQENVQHVKEYDDKVGTTEQSYLPNSSDEHGLDHHDNRKILPLNELMSVSISRSYACCSICLESLEISTTDNDTSMNNQIAWSRHNAFCHHVFHYDCLTTWLMKSDFCPYCRRRILFWCEDGEINNTCNAVAVVRNEDNTSGVENDDLQHLDSIDVDEQRMFHNASINTTSPMSGITPLMENGSSSIPPIHDHDDVTDNENNV